MNLRAEFGLQRGSLHLDVDLRVAAGETVALLGPNGAGKSTGLHTIAGLLAIQRGHVALGERVFDRGPGAPFEPAERRRIGVVFQDALLFGHFDVRDNVAYGPRCRGASREVAFATALRWLSRVGLAECAALRPAQLSGGQRQRVALARALAAEPELLLLDEPLAAVDASAKIALRRELRTHLGDFTGPRLIVTHDLGDALALADRIVVLEAGRVVQQGPIGELVARPRSRYVADLVGINCFFGEGEGGTVRCGEAQLVVASELTGPVVATIHPRAVALFRDRPSGSPRNVFVAPVAAVEAQLDERVRVSFGGALPIVAEVTPAAVRDLGLVPGANVWVAVKATEIDVSPR